MTAGLTYWRCPECGTRVEVPMVYVPPAKGVRETMWNLIPLTALRCEQMVEAHEAKHLGGGV